MHIFEKGHQTFVLCPIVKFRASNRKSRPIKGLTGPTKLKNHPAITEGFLPLRSNPPISNVRDFFHMECLLKIYTNLIA